LGRIRQLVLRLAEDGADQAVHPGQRLQGSAVLALQRLAVVLHQRGPVPLGRNRRFLAQVLGALLVHLQEQQVGDLLDVVAVGNALVAQHVRVVPDLGDQLVVSHAVPLFIPSPFGCTLPRARGMLRFPQAKDTAWTGTGSSWATRPAAAASSSPHRRSPISTASLWPGSTTRPPARGTRALSRSSTATAP